MRARARRQFTGNRRTRGPGPTTQALNQDNDTEFEKSMVIARRINNAAHAAGLKTVWYIPALEAVTKWGRTPMSELHPDWLQRGWSYYDECSEMALAGGGSTWKCTPQANLSNIIRPGPPEPRPRPALPPFVPPPSPGPTAAGDPGAWWVQGHQEGAWMSPNSGWREYFAGRVRKIVEAGADGLWMDVPIYFNSMRQFSDTSFPGAVAFARETGLQLPRAIDWSDPVFRRWIVWRHEALGRFVAEMAREARAQRPDTLVLAQVYTLDWADGTLAGLDGGYFTAEENVSVVWEVDKLSNANGMRCAREEDWQALIALFKYGRGAVGPSKPSWAFSYGSEASDAEAVLAECIAAGNAPYETKIPGKTESVGREYRRRVYGFLARHGAAIFPRRSLAGVAVYFSSPSRDFVDRSAPGTGQFCTTAPPAGCDVGSVWWAWAPFWSCYARPYLSEYRGTVRALLHAGVPFDVLASPAATAADLFRYKTVYFPGLEALSDAEAAAIRAFVAAGGTAVLTGPRPTALDQYGANRTELALADVLGFSSAAAAPPAAALRSKAKWRRAVTGAGFEALAGPALRESGTPWAALEAGLDRRLHLEAAAAADDPRTLAVHVTNYVGRPSALDPAASANWTVAAAEAVVVVRLWGALRSVRVATFEAPEPREVPHEALPGPAPPRIRVPLRLAGPYALLLPPPPRSAPRRHPCGPEGGAATAASGPSPGPASGGAPPAAARARAGLLALALALAAALVILA
eukprot:tig00021432_g21234.t1